MNAVLSGSFAARLPQFELLVFSGPDTKAFLQGQLSCDVEPLAARAVSTFGAYCSAQGRMLANFLLWRQGEDWHMLLSSSIAEAVKKRLSMFVLRAKVSIARRTDMVLAGFGGRDAEDCLRQAGVAFPEAPDELIVKKGLTAIALPGGRWLLAGDRVPDVIRTSSSLISVGPSAWDWTDIREGIPWITARTQDQFVPQMAGMDQLGGVSFKKGCYPGQEIVARTQYLGKLKRRLYRAHVDASAEAGDAVFGEDVNGQSNGMVVNAAPAPGGGSDMLVVVQSESAENSRVHLQSLDGALLQILTLPHPKP